MANKKDNNSEFEFDSTLDKFIDDNKNEQGDFDFSPILDKLEEENNKKVEDTSLSTTNQTSTTADLVEYKINQDVLSIINLLGLADNHIVDNKNCRKELDKIDKLLTEHRDSMSIKELLDYQKNIMQREQYNSDYIYKSYNYILKTEYAKRLISGSNKELNKVEKSEKKKINNVMKLFEETEE